jgi:hypothetical protein
MAKAPQSQSSNRAAQIKSALSAASDLLAAKNARRLDSRLLAADVSQRPELLSTQRSLQSLMASSLTKAGFELDKFEDLRARHQSDLRRLVEEHKADAIKAATSASERLRADLDGRRQAIETLAGTAAAQYVLLNSPFLIWPTHGLFFDSSQIVPSNSWAKFTLESSRSSGYEEMSFYYLWDNPSDQYAVINVDGYLVLNGFCRTGSDGGFWPGDRRSSLTVDARLYLLEWWNQPPTSPPFQADQYQQALQLATSTGGFGDPGAIEFRQLFRGFDLRYTLFLVPPHGVVVFEVVAAISYALADGHVSLDFASGDFKAISPAVLVAIVT